MFLGINLIAEALWDSSKALQFGDGAVVGVTLLTCTFVGFAPGISAGVGIALMTHYVRDVFVTVRTFPDSAIQSSADFKNTGVA